MRILKIFIFLIIFLASFSSVFGYTVSSVDITPSYKNSSGTINYTGVATGTAGEIIQLNAFSGKDGTGIDINVTLSAGGTFSGGFSILLEGTSTTTQLGTNLEDTVTLKDIQNSKEDTVIIDGIEPTNSATITITPESVGKNYENYYSGKITVTYDADDLTDEETYIDKHIIYVIPVSYLSSYSTRYTKKYVDSNTTETKDINSLTATVIPDGNYYVVIDVNDIAGNYSDSDDVLATKKNVYFDNTKPVINSVLIGTTEKTIDANKIYTKDTNFSLKVLLSDASGIKEDSELTLTRPDSGIRKSLYDSTNGFVISSSDINGAWTNAQVFRVNIDAIDNVGNNLNYDFNIILDLNAPTIPNKNTLAIEDKDKNVTITWQSNASTDPTGGSGFKEYRVYRYTSTFTTVNASVHEHICTVSSTTYTCKDADDEDKDMDIYLYYGLVGVDNVGNISDANTQRIWTGPECSVEINDGNDYTNLATVRLDINYSSDANEMAFSCNNSTFSTYEEIDDRKIFNITSGNGCTTTNQEKTIYVKVRSEDYPTRTTTCSNKIYYDNTPPTVPTNLLAIAQADGSVKLTWTASTDANTYSDIKYRIYYSDTNTVTTSSSYKESLTNSYIFKSNQDLNLYFKVSALDERNNESALSSAVFARVRKIGPRFTITIDSANDVNNVIYVGAGTKTIVFESDEVLISNPTMSIKQGTDNYVTASITYDSNSRKGQTTFNFTKAGAGIIKITGTNTKNEQAITEYPFTIDITVPDFNFGHIVQNPTTYKIWVSQLPTDIFKVVYLLNDSTEVCKKQLVTDYNCVYNATSTADGNHTMYVDVYDKSLNKKRKSFSFILNNIDEDKVTCEELNKDITKTLNGILDNLELFRAVDIYKTLDQEINAKIGTVNAKRSAADDKFTNYQYASAKTDYLAAQKELAEISKLLPPITITKTTSINITFDENSTISPIILDKNISDKTKKLYSEKSITVDRNFDVLRIGNQNFFSVTLSIDNNSNSEKEITIIEDIPKSFSNHISKLTFNKKVEVLVKDPVVKYTTKIPAKSSEYITYRYLNPITDIDIVTKYNTIKFATPLIIDGNISDNQLDIKKPINTFFLIYLLLAVIFLVIVIIIIGAISHYHKHKVEVKPDSKKMMYDYFGVAENNKQVQEQKKQEKVTEKKKDTGEKFNEDYQYILSAIKKR